MPKDCPPVPLERVLRAELSEIQQVRAMRGNIGKTGEPRDPAAQPEAPIAGKANPSEPAWQTDEDTADWVQAIKEAHAANLVGLAFSGGGIRSATFNLGVLQALAELKLLHRIDYLSTVSGGGYIGGWLAAWTKRLGSFGEVQKRLATNRVHQIDDKEPPPIRFLRVFSNYLTPKLGILSGDTLAMASIYLRNMILNQVIVLAVLTFLLLLPRAVVNAISLTNGTQWNASVWAVAGGGLLLLAFLVIFNNMSFLDSREEHALTWLTKQFAILCLVGGPLFFVAILAALFLARESRAEELPFGRTAMWGAGIYAAVWLVVSAVAGGFDWWHRRRVEAGAKAAEAESKPGAVDPKQSTTSAGSISVLDRLGDFLITVLGAACAGALAGCLYAFLSKSWWCWCDQKALTIGAPMVLAIFLLAGALHIGLMGTVFHDAAREWWGRLGGWLLLWGVLWMAIFWVSLYFPDFIRNDKLVRAAWKAAAAKYLTPAWILTTLASVMAGKSTASGEPGKKTWNDWIAKVGPYVFITGLVCWISWCIDKIGHKYFLAAKAFRMQAASSDALDFFNFGHLAANWIKSYPIYAAILGCAALAMVMAWRVDVNQFSMHLFYRNRLVRCYLGASNENRSPNRFTGFDRTDDMPLKDLRKKSGYDGPYPIMNASLNLVKGKDLAWQERKAESQGRIVRDDTPILRIRCLAGGAGQSAAG